VQFWIVKGRPSRNDLDEMLAPGRTQRWVTRKPPRTWAAGDGVFFWKGAPALRLVGMGQLKKPNAKDAAGNAYFVLTYLTRPLDHPLGIEELRRDRVVGKASFLKAGAAGTVFPLSDRQAARLLELVRDRNGAVAICPWDQEPVKVAPPDRALSVRQPWAELIVRGVKQIEVRSKPTHVRGRVYIYASMGEVDSSHCRRIEREHHIDIALLPRGVLVGTVEIVGCRPLATRDSTLAALSIARGRTDFAWLLAEPRRSDPAKPRNHPQPVFFRPF